MRNGEAENNRILEKYGDIMTESERSAFRSLREKNFQQEEIKERRALLATQDVICATTAVALTSLIEKVPLFSGVYPHLPIVIFTLLMILSPWGCLLLSRNKKEEWIFYIIGRSESDNMLGSDNFLSRHPYVSFFLFFVMMCLLPSVWLLSIMFFCWLRQRPGWMLHTPYLSDIDGRNLFKKSYGVLAGVAPVIFSYSLFTALPQPFSTNLTAPDFLILLIVTQGAWTLNWVLVALLSLYAFLCELPGNATENGGSAMHGKIRERYWGSFNDAKDRKILPVGSFMGIITIGLLVFLLFTRLGNRDIFLFCQSAGLLSLWLILLFLIIALVRSHITDKLLCYAFREESKPTAIMLDAKLLARQYKSLKIAAWFLLAAYLTGGALLI